MSRRSSAARVSSGILVENCSSIRSVCELLAGDELVGTSVSGVQLADRRHLRDDRVDLRRPSAGSIGGAGRLGRRWRGRLAFGGVERCRRRCSRRRRSAGRRRRGVCGRLPAVGRAGRRGRAGRSGLGVDGHAAEVRNDAEAKQERGEPTTVRGGGRWSLSALCQPDRLRTGFRGLMSVSSPTALLGLNASILSDGQRNREASLPVPSPSLGTRGANWAGAPRFFLSAARASVRCDNHRDGDHLFWRDLPALARARRHRRRRCLPAR